MAANHITKQLVQDTLMDEGLRVVRQLAQQIHDDGSGVDLRVFNKISQDSTLVNSSLATTASSGQPSVQSSGYSDQVRPVFKSEIPRPRGRPPKILDYGGPLNQVYQNTAVPRSPAAHHLLPDFMSSHMQHNMAQSSGPTALAFNPNGFNACSASNSSLTDDEPNEANESSNGHSFGQMDAQKPLSISATDLSKYTSNSLINGNKDSNLSVSPKSLSALIPINSNGIHDSYKQDINCSTI